MEKECNGECDRLRRMKELLKQISILPEAGIEHGVTVVMIALTNMQADIQAVLGEAGEENSPS